MFIFPNGITVSVQQVSAQCQTSTDESTHRQAATTNHFWALSTGSLFLDLASPLYKLLHRAQPWLWDELCQGAFEEMKNALALSSILAHYDPDKPLQVACDASQYGVGAVLSHVTEDGSSRPVFYASRTLTDAEKKYSQLEKEALAIIFAVKKFHFYIYERCFTLITDHKPLQTILGQKTGIPPIAAARLQRWAVTLSAYKYSLVYKKSSDNAEAYFFSRPSRVLKMTRPKARNRFMPCVWTLCLCPPNRLCSLQHVIRCSVKWSSLQA